VSESRPGGSVGVSAAAVEPLAWDSAFFGFPVAQISADAPDREQLAVAVEACERTGVRCAYLLLDAADARGSEAAQALGFVVRDVRVELDRPVEAADATLAGGDGPAIAEARAEQLPALEALVRERLTTSRFFADPGFPRERCRELYAAFLRRGIEDAPKRWTLATPDASGCVVCLSERERGVGTFELAATRRRGEGAALVRAGLARLAGEGITSARIVTQAHNIASQRTFQRAGFRTCRSGLWLHRWFG
jgi:dTDP-4-amino-4,6-dideoxy-D-galactose acyltransferase